MQLGMIGLGRMWANMVRRLMAADHECVAFDRSPQAVDDLARHGAKGVASLKDLVRAADDGNLIIRWHLHEIVLRASPRGL
jgi:6-phosphogluconate dehydrogenase